MVQKSEKNDMEKIEDLVRIYKKKSCANISFFTEKNKRYGEYIGKCNKYREENSVLILDDARQAYFESRELKGKKEFFPNFHVDFKQLTENTLLFIELHIYYRLYKMRSYNERILDDINEVVGMKGQEKTVWFRGQTNSNWQLVPSFFRNAKKTFLWTWNDVYADYGTKPKKVSLIKKLDEVDINTKTCPYKTAAFIQHSIGYSPLVDFSRSPQVALSFSLSNGASMVSYYGDNSCVFALDITGYRILVEDEEINNAIRNAKVQVFRKNESIINIISNKMWLDLMKGIVSSEINPINRPTNDRMFFQKGTFIFYNNAIVMDNELYLSFSKAAIVNFRLTKFVIETKAKEIFYEALMKAFPQYHQRYLMDPYQYLGEPDK